MHAFRKPSLDRWKRGVAVVALLMLGSGGCGDCAARGAYHDHVRHRTEAQVYEQPREELWRQVVELLAERGFALPAETPVAGVTIASDWMQTEYGRQRMQVRLEALSDQRHIVRIESRYEADPVPGAASPKSERPALERQLDLEWMLFERVDPARALEVAAEANRRSDEVWENRARFGCV